VEFFGPGDFDEYLTVFVPGIAAPWAELRHRIREEMDGYRFILSRSSADYYEPPPYEMYPTPGGLVPWGETHNGDTLAWLTRGEPDEWPVFVVPVEGSEQPFLFEGCMAEFIYRFLFDDLEVECLSLADEEPVRRFNPGRGDATASEGRLEPISWFREPS
jgi:hypothetical protein